MATIAFGTHVSALEISRHFHDKRLLPLIQTLSQQMEMFSDVHMEMCNDGTGHVGVTQSSQPTGTYRSYNQGIATEASTSEEFREPTTMLDGRWRADKALLLHKAGGNMGNAATIRARMINEYIIGMLKTFQTSIFYGTRSDGKSPKGLTQRANWSGLSSSYTHDNAGGAASGTANKTSMWLIGHGPEKYAWIFPDGDAPGSGTIIQPGSPITGLGVKVVPLPDDLDTDLDAGVNQFYAVRNWLELHLGHAVMDARYIQRMVNISTSNIDGVDDFSFDENVMIDMLEAMPDHQNAVFYCNKTLRAQLRKRVSEKGNVWQTVTDPFGKKQIGYDGIPIHIVERITNTEATVI